jgi:hypothetical protein
VDPPKKPPFSYRGLGWRVVGIGGRPELHQDDLAPKLDEVLAQIRVGRNEADERGGGIGLAVGEVSFEDGVVAVGHCRSPRPCDRSEARGPETEAGTVDNAAVESWAQASRRVDRVPSSRLCPGAGSASVFRGLYALGLDSVAARAKAVLTCINRFYFQMRVHQRRPQASRPRDASTPAAPNRSGFSKAVCLGSGGQGLVADVGMRVHFGLGGRDVADRREQAAVDHLRPEQAADCLRPGVVVTVADAADRRLDAQSGQAPGVPWSQVLRAAVRVTNQPVALTGATLAQFLLQCI